MTGIPLFGMPLSLGSELTLFPAEFWLLCCQKRDSQQVWAWKGPSAKLIVCDSFFSRAKCALAEVEPDACELWLDPWSSRWAAHRSPSPLAQRVTAPRAPFRADHGWSERLFVQWGNNHRVRKGKQGAQPPEPPECLQPEPRRFLAWSSRGKWGWLQLCRTPEESGGVVCSSREEEMKMEFLYSTVWSGGLILRLLAEVTPCVLPLLLPLKKKQTLAKMLQDACCHLCIWDKPRHKASVSPSNSVWEATQHFAEVQQFSCILLLSLPPYKTVSTSFMVGLTPVLMSFKILQYSACFNL